MNQLPKHTYITKAALVNDPFSDDVISEKDMLDQLEKGNSSLYLDIVALDTYTGERVLLEGVELRNIPNTPFSGIGPDSTFQLYSPSYEAFKRKQVEKLYVIKENTKPKLVNKSLPEPVKLKNTVDSFFDSKTKACVKYNQSLDQLKQFKGYVYDRDDIKDYSGDSENSGGMLVHNADGTLYLYDKTGKNYVVMDGSNITAIAPEVEIGKADVARTNEYGFVHNNKANDSIIQGTILAPSTNIIPNFLKIANTALMIYDLVDFVVTLGLAVTEATENDDDA